jgi:hypothetical protein
VVPAALVHPLTVIVTEYIPVARVEAPVIEGFCEVDVKLLGPVHAYVPPPGLAVKFNVDPSQIAELFTAVGAAGVGFTTTAIVEAALPQPDTFTPTE